MLVLNGQSVSEIDSLYLLAFEKYIDQIDSFILNMVEKLINMKKYFLNIPI